MKKFSIHDWQAKQRQQRLYELEEWGGFGDPGGHPRGGTGPGKRGLIKLSQDEVMTIYNNFMDTHKYKETVIDDPDGDKENATLKIDTEDGKSYEVLTSAVGDEKWWEWGSGPKSSAKNEHHDSEDFPKVSQKTKEYLDKLENTDPAAYKAVEDYIKAMGGESSQANNSMWTSTSTTDDLTDTEEEEEEEKEKVDWRNFRENTTSPNVSATGGPGMGHFGDATKKKRK
jgi:hypothetical protein